MREFSWNVFAVTGNIEAYLLYRECEGQDCQDEEEQLQLVEEQSEIN